MTHISFWSLAGVVETFWEKLCERQKPCDTEAVEFELKPLLGHFPSSRITVPYHSTNLGTNLSASNIAQWQSAETELPSGPLTATAVGSVNAIIVKPYGTRDFDSPSLIVTSAYRSNATILQSDGTGVTHSPSLTRAGRSSNITLQSDERRLISLQTSNASVLSRSDAETSSCAYIRGSVTTQTERGKARVLIVEDSDFDTKRLAELLRKLVLIPGRAFNHGLIYSADDLYDDVSLRFYDWTTAREFVKILIGGVTILDILKAIQDAQRESARSGFNRQLQCSTFIKALHKPLQVIPQSIHPIDAAAYLGC